MERTKSGTFSITLDLDLNREYQYRYLVNGLDWHNDGMPISTCLIL